MTSIQKKFEMPKTMSSLEIAELTGKEHKNILRDIRAMVAELHGSELSFVCDSMTYESSNGQSYPMYSLDKETTLTLLLGYDVVARMKVIKRWAQLEADRQSEDLNPDRLIQRYEEGWRKKGRTDEWITARLKTLAGRHEFTDTLKDHQVKGAGFGMCTNSIYTPLFGGGADMVRKKKGLAKNDNIRDNMSSLELTSVSFAEELAKDRITLKNINGNARCSNASYSAAMIVKNAINANRE